MKDLCKNSDVRDFWWNYRSEVVFGVVLSALVVFSYWAAAFIPESIFETFINPAEYVATIVVCFMGAWVIFRHHDHNILRIAWGYMLIVWGVLDVVLMVVRYGLNITAIGGTPDDPLYNASLTVGNLLAWMLFIYPSMVLRPGWLTWTKALLLVMPMVVLGVIDYYVAADLLPLIMIYPVVLFLMLCSHIRRYRQWCEDNFSSMDSIDVQWIVRYLTILFLLGVSFYFICFWYVPNRMFTQQWLLLLILTYSTEQILFRKDPWSDVSAGTDECEPAVRTDDQKDEVAMLVKWIAENKPYRNPDFQLMDLRQVVPSNRTRLSNLIRAAYGCTFFQMANRFRVEEAKRFMTDNPDMKLSVVALTCGFASLQTFSRTFTRATGMAPREWRDKLQEGKKFNNS